MDNTIALNNALTSIDEYIKNYRRGLFTISEVSEGIFDTLLNLSLNNCRQLHSEIIPLCAEYIILDAYAVSQMKNVISEWKSNWRVGLTDFMRNVQNNKSISDKEKLTYYRAYMVLYNYPEYTI